MVPLNWIYSSAVALHIVPIYSSAAALHIATILRLQIAIYVKTPFCLSVEGCSDGSKNSPPTISTETSRPEDLTALIGKVPTAE